MSDPRRRRSAGGEGLPDPEIDILKTSYFARPTVSGGPHMDALLYNQATIMRMLQDIRTVQAHGITLEGTKATTRQGFASEVADIMADEDMAGRLASIAIQWVSEAPANKMAKTRSNKNISVVANATFNAFKEGLAELWGKEDFNNETDGNLVTMLKAIEGNEAKKEDLHIAVAKRLAAMSKNPAATEAEGIHGQSGSPSGEVQEEGVGTGARVSTLSSGRHRGHDTSGRRARGSGRGSGRAGLAGRTNPTLASAVRASSDADGDGSTADAELQGQGSVIDRPRKRRQIVDSDDEENNKDGDSMDFADK